MSERTEAPTPKRISEARKKGQVARSHELSSAAMLLAAAVLLRGPGATLVQESQNLMVTSIASINNTEVTVDSITGIFMSAVQSLLPSLVLIGAGFLATAVIVNTAQTKLLFTTSKWKPDISRLNPINGFKRMFSKNGLIELGKSLLKLLVVGYFAYDFLNGNKDQFLSLEHQQLSLGISHFVDMAFSLILRVAAAYFALAAMDYLYQRWSYMKSMRMNREEIKEEMKQQEGDPFIRGRIRSQQRRMARMRMMSNVHKASVVVVNPTHLAIAIQYDPKNMSAPKVVAKGAHLVAQRIVKIAKENNIPVIQNIPVARALFKAVEIDREIPGEFYTAIAEILAYVYRMKNRAVSSAN